MTRFLPTAAILSAAALSTGVFAAPVMADTFISEPVTLSYDVAQLEASNSAESVLRDLERQAREACMSIAPIVKTQIIDTACVSDVLTQAIQGINNTALTTAYNRAEGYEVVALNTAADARSES